MRKNNIECIKCKPNNPYHFEIVKWYKNPYYGKEADYDLDNWGDYRPKNTVGVHINKNCFKNPEVCYTVAHLIKTKEGFDLKTVGNRILDLDAEDFQDFWAIYKKKVKYKN